MGPIFRPIHEAHAIVEMVAFIQFAQNLPKEALERAVGLREELKSDFPKAELMSVFEMKADNVGGISAPTSSLGGIELSRFNPDGTLSWRLQFAANSISINCLDYDRWATTWPKMQIFLAAALEKVTGSNIEVGAAGIKYIDRFYCTSEAVYDTSALFREDTPYLNSHTFTGGPRWHAHTGWYQSIGETTEEYLSQLNIDSAFELPSRRVVVTIDHTLSRRLTVPGELVRYRQPPSAKARYWTKLADQLHDENKFLLNHLLTDDMSKRIGLKD